MKRRSTTRIGIAAGLMLFLLLFTMTAAADCETEGHDWKATKYVWTEDGSEATAYRECRRTGCGAVEMETVAAVETVKAPATCTASGYAEMTATFTNPAFETQTRGKTIAATGHQMEDYPEVEPTCTEPGHHAGQICAVCGYKIDGQERSALGHDKVYLKNKAPTCTEPGLTGRAVCSRCGIVMAEGTVEPATGHDWETTCAWNDDYTTATLRQKCRNDKTHTRGPETVVTMRLNADSWNLAPTETTGGSFWVCPQPPFEEVEGVNPWTFMQKKPVPAIRDMDKLELPADLRVIERGAFENTASQYIRIPDGCERIESGAFRNCTELLYVIIPAGTEAEEGAFEGCRYVYILRLVGTDRGGHP